ncbi:serine/threonine-protein kinase [Streptomyces natalensis]|uniref:serine/threonine-protein kinase n=1 Tax=Streptomyces natalensis TaxID=68242 RepID=UPI0006922303|nr:protein kinase [Streptomyces natalensis]
MIGGRYRLVSDLGSGGFGRVWKARDETLRIDVAVKEIWLPPAVSEAEQAERLARAAREARNAARLRDHTHVVTVHDVVVEDGLPWIVMQLVDGCSLEEHLATHGPLSVEHAEKVARALLRALGAAHEAGIVHRDVKPANVMLTRGGDVLLTDFGIAVHHTDTALTTTGAIIGSVEYMAPERVRGTDGLPAGDVFSLGVTLYQAVEGFSPFRRGTPTGCMAAVLFEEAPPSKRAGRLAPLITALLDKDPDRRPDTRAALARLASPTVPWTVHRAPRAEAYLRIAGAVRALAEARRAEVTRTAGVVHRPPRTEAESVVPTTTARPRPGVTTKAARPRSGVTTTTARPRSGKALQVTASIALVVAIAIAVTLVQSRGDTGDKTVCDRAFEDIAVFQQTYPSFTTEDRAAKAAADRLAADLRAERAKASDTNVSIALGNYAAAAPEGADVGGGDLRTQLYDYLLTACQKVGSTPRSS